MSRSSIGGTLGLDALAALYGDARPRADEHRPQTHAEMRIAALEMARSGLLPRDIAVSLRISESAVRSLLEVAE